MANEKRLICANALMDEFRAYMVDRYDREKCVSEENCKTCENSCLWRKMVSVAPTVDAVEVEHGYWIDSHTVDHIGRIIEHGIDCSVCDSVFKDDSREVVKHWKEQFKVCPFCGAKMDLSQITEQTTDALMKMGENAHGEGN